MCNITTHTLLSPPPLIHHSLHYTLNRINPLYTLLSHFFFSNSHSPFSHTRSSHTLTTTLPHPLTHHFLHHTLHSTGSIRTLRLTPLSFLSLSFLSPLTCTTLTLTTHTLHSHSLPYSYSPLSSQDQSERSDSPASFFDGGPFSPFGASPTTPRAYRKTLNNDGRISGLSASSSLTSLHSLPLNTVTEDVVTLDPLLGSIKLQGFSQLSVADAVIQEVNQFYFDNLLLDFLPLFS